MKNLSLIILISIVTAATQSIPADFAYYKNGAIKAIKYYKKYGNKIEIHRVEGYYKNAQQKYDKTYKNGTRDGKWTYWHDNGTIECSAIYRNGIETKDWEFFNLDGTKKDSINSATLTRYPSTYKENEKIDKYEVVINKSKYFSGHVYSFYEDTLGIKKQLKYTGRCIYGDFDGKWK